MITDFFINLWTSICTGLASSLPVSTPFDAASSGAGWSMFTAMNYFLPISELLSVFAGVFLLGGPMMLVTLTIWVLVGVLRGGATRA